MGLKEMALAEAKKRKQKIEDEIREEELKLVEARKQAEEEKKRLASELTEMAKKATEFKEEKKVDPLDALTEDKNHKFSLATCYDKNDIKIDFTYTIDNKEYNITLVPLKMNTTLVEVDAQEMADDIHERMDWASSWTSGLPQENMVTYIDQKPKGFTKTIDSGIMELGTTTPDVREFFLSGSYIKGLLVLRQIESVPKPGLGVELRWYSNFATREDSPTPYILSSKAVNADVIPLEGRACLPKRVKKRVPLRYRYWNEPNADQRLRIRNTLVKHINDGTISVPYGDEYNAKFSVLKEWVPREEEVFHLVTERRGVKSYITDANLVAALDDFVMTEQPFEVPIEDAKEGVVELSDEPRLVKAVDWGRCHFYEDFDNQKTIRFAGAKLKGIWGLSRVDGDVWEVSMMEPPRTSGRDLTNGQVDTIVEMTRAKKERPEIARSVGCCNMTVYQYQKTLGLV